MYNVSVTQVSFIRYGCSRERSKPQRTTATRTFARRDDRPRLLVFSWRQCYFQERALSPVQIRVECDKRAIK